MRKLLQSTAALVLAFALSSCGTGSQFAETTTGRVITAATASITGKSTPPKPEITRALFADVPVAVNLLQVPSRDAIGTMIVAGTNRDTTTWISADGVSVALRNGQLVSTRGWGDDIISSDTAAASRALSNGSGSYKRSHTYLNGEDQLIKRTWSCSLVSKGTERVVVVEVAKTTRRYDETCNGPSGDFQNTYWVAGSSVHKASYWVGSELGNVQISVIQK